MGTEQQQAQPAPPLQTEPPRNQRETLPTMYDLPSETPGESGFPDEFHCHQSQLLRETFQPPHYHPNCFFVASDLYLYYDVQHPTWYKRPDWFAALGVPRFYDTQELRLSYVIWQEKAAPYLMIELLSPGTEHEDLGKTKRDSDEPPTKWMVYEQLLQTPYYVVFNWYTDKLQFFVLKNNRYKEVYPADQRLWLPDAGLGLGLWSGMYQGFKRYWLRFYDKQGAYPQTQQEQIEQERHKQQEFEQERQRAECLVAQLKALGIEPEQ